MDSDSFDPLVEFYGMWNIDLAERYLPIPELPLAKYECWDGRLYMSPPPYEAAANSFGEAKLINLFSTGAEQAQLYLYGSVNLLLGDWNRWIQPDLTVLKSPEVGSRISSEYCVLVVEFISPSSRRRDVIDKPRVCAEIGIPWYMTVELQVHEGSADVVMYKLVDGRYVHAAQARQGQRFEIAEPFTASFDPVELLVRKPW